MTSTTERNVLDEDVDLNPQDLDVGRLASVAALALGLVHFWASWSGGFPLLQMRSVHIGGVLVVLWLVLLHQSKRRRNPLLIAATALVIGVSVYFMGLVFVSDDEILRRFAMAPDWQLALGLIVMLICLEASRRVMGVVLPAIVVGAALIVLFADKISLISDYVITVDGKDLVNTLTFSTNGLFGSITGASAGVIASFLILGSFLTASGGSQSFLNLARFLVGRFRGGPAKVSLLTSALFGTVSGSAVANVVVDGVFNIPLMKRSGYRPEFAAAVEANASTGGQIVPPVMGSAAFLMAEFLGIPYSDVLIAAIIPAALYYLALLITCHVEALKLGLPAIPKKQLPKANTLITREFVGSFAAPLTVLMIYLYVFDRSLMYASWAATMTVIIYMLTLMPVPFTVRVRKIIDAFRLSGIEIARIGAIVVAAQLMVTIMGISGMGPRIANELAGQNLPLAATLAILGITVILIGFPLPTAPAYILAASVANPLFTALNIDPLAGHMFLLYFAVYGNVTPPVMPSVYPAAAIARCDSMKAGWEASRLLAPAILVPFAFVLEPDILLTHGAALSIVLAVARMSVGILFVSCGLAFWALRPLPRWSGLLLAFAGVLVAWPGATTTATGAVLAAVALLPVLKGRRTSDVEANTTGAGVVTLPAAAAPLDGDDDAAIDGELVEVRGDGWTSLVKRASAVLGLREVGPSSTVVVGRIDAAEGLAAADGVRATGATLVLAPSASSDAVTADLVSRAPALALGPPDVTADWTAAGLTAATWVNLSDRIQSTAPWREEPADSSTTVVLLGAGPDDRSAVSRQETTAARRRRTEQMAGSFGFTGNDRLLLPAALDPVWVVAFAEAAHSAGAVVAIEPSATFDPQAWLDAVDRAKVSTAVLTTTMLGAVVEHARTTGATAPETLVAVIHGGDPCDVDVKRAGIALFGPILIEFFGTVDGAGTVIASEDWLDDVDAIGRSWSDDVEVFTVDGDGRRLPAGERGQIALAWNGDGITVSRRSASGDEQPVDVEHPYVTALTGTVDGDGLARVDERLAFEDRDAVLVGASPGRSALAASIDSIVHHGSS